MKNLDILKNLLFNPQKAWLEIEKEPSSLQNILKYQLLVFALFPVAGAFLLDVVIGVEMFEKVYRKPIITALISSLLYYIAIIMFVFLLALGLKLIASFFESKVLFIKDGMLCKTENKNTGPWTITQVHCNGTVRIQCGSMSE